MSTEEQQMYNQLAFYTLSQPDKIFFIHQLVVDAYTAQHADAQTKPIAITFALAGLYLVVEKNYTGKQVQLVHVEMSKRKILWPSFVVPEHRGSLRISDVLAEEPGESRDIMIRKWCEDVWKAFAGQKDKVLATLP